MLNWVNQFNIFCFLDNREYDLAKPAFECLVAAGSKKNIEVRSGHAFETFQNFYASHTEDWLFGHLGYDLKNDDGQMASAHFDGIQFSDLHFFVPEIVLELDRQEVKIYSEANGESIFKAIASFPSTITPIQNDAVNIQSRIAKDDYISIIEKLRSHILRGDCYEINFCQEFFAEKAVIDPLAVYERLTTLSPNPFAAYYKVNDKYCCCASPERYLKKNGRTIFSQPIKGTSKRDHDDQLQDEANKQYLLQSPKERSENVMVVDLVRNDMSRVCVPGSVKVEELFGLYSFPQVHQMISTISGELEPDAGIVDILRATFPMGSMTGAPKIRVMQLIEQYEQTRRGLFSGTIGYIRPDGDFDFNVVIRSMMYNATEQYLSFQTGGGITFYSDPEKEYEECLLKAEAMLKIIQ